MFLNILVAIDGLSSSRRALGYAIDLARAGNARLTLMTVAPPPGAFVARTGVSAETMRAELDSWAEGILKAAAGAISDGVIPHRVQRTGHAGPEIVKELERGGHDLIVLWFSRPGTCQEGLLGSVNGYVNFHSRVPLLSVPDEHVATRELRPDDDARQGAASVEAWQAPLTRAPCGGGARRWQNLGLDLES